MAPHYNWIRYWRIKTRSLPHGTDDMDTRRTAMAIDLKIPSGLSLENWNPDEQPLTVAGSIFDVNFLCEWMQKWTSYHYGPQHETMGVARYLSVLAADLDARLDHVYAALPSDRADRGDLVSFIYRGDSLWERFQTLIYKCSKSMHPKGKDGYPSVDKRDDAAIEFVSALFDSKKKRAKTEKLILKISRWNDEFDSSFQKLLHNSYDNSNRWW